MEYLVIYDGTSAFIIPVEDLGSMSDDCEVLASFDDIEEAEEFCDIENEKLNKC